MADDLSLTVRLNAVAAILRPFISAAKHIPVLRVYTAYVCPTEVDARPVFGDPKETTFSDSFVPSSRNSSYSSTQETSLDSASFNTTSDPDAMLNASEMEIGGKWILSWNRKNQAFATGESAITQTKMHIGRRESSVFMSVDKEISSKIHADDERDSLSRRINVQRSPTPITLFVLTSEGAIDVRKSSLVLKGLCPTETATAYSRTGPRRQDSVLIGYYESSISSISDFKPRIAAVLTSPLHGITVFVEVGNLADTDESITFFKEAMVSQIVDLCRQHQRQILRDCFVARLRNPSFCPIIAF
jgi:hypothetical protein